MKQFGIKYAVVAVALALILGGCHLVIGTIGPAVTQPGGKDVDQPQPQAPSVNSVVGIAVQQFPNTLYYMVGDTFSAEGLELSAVYTDRTTEVITSGYTLTVDGTPVESATATAGNKTVTAVWQDYSAVFPIRVLEPGNTPVITEDTVAGIIIREFPRKLDYEQGEPFSTEGLVVEAVYVIGRRTETITSYTLQWNGQAITEGNTEITAEVGNKTVTAVWRNGEDYTAVFPVRVKEVVEDPDPGEEPPPVGDGVVGITIREFPNKLYYKVGDAFSEAGLAVDVVYGDKRTESLESGYTLEYEGAPVETITATAGNKTVTVIWQDEQEETYTAVFPVKVWPGDYMEPGPATAVGIVIREFPDNVYYAEGDPFSTAGLAVEAMYANKSTQNVTNYITLKWGEQTIANGQTNTITAEKTNGPKTVTVEWGEFTAVFPVRVVDLSQLPGFLDMVNYIRIAQEPIEKTYRPYLYRPIDTEGLVVEYVLKDGRSGIVPDTDWTLWFNEISLNIYPYAISGYPEHMAITVKWYKYSDNFGVEVEGFDPEITDAVKWDDALNFIRTNLGGIPGRQSRRYTLNIAGNFAIPAQGNIDKQWIEIELTGDGTITLNSDGSLLTVGPSQKLVIDGPTLKGKNPNTASLVKVEAQGELELKDGVIRGNKSSTKGGGVWVSGNATFTMSGGTISGNSTTSSGGGVEVAANGTFTMDGGTISGNSSPYDGGGVHLAVYGGHFTMHDGTISGNNAWNGGGMYADSLSTFTMSGGTISNNTTQSDGAGVYVMGASGYKATFTMDGGTISGNSSAYGHGGGVFVFGGNFSKIGGIIYGNDRIVDYHDFESNKNTALASDEYGGGHAVYYAVNNTFHYCNIDLPEGKNISTDALGWGNNWIY